MHLPTRCIVGLGNPGTQYHYTRHNAGFLVVTKLAELMQVYDRQVSRPYKAHIAQGIYTTSTGSGKVFFICPQTFMNLSGDSVAPFANFHKILPEHICVIHDDIDLPAGEVKYKIGGGSGGQNGLKDITQKLGSDTYHRLRIGIGRPVHPSMSVADYVLSRWDDHSLACVDDYAREGYDKLQHHFLGL